MIAAIKAKTLPLKLRKDLDKYLRAESKRTGKTMVRLVEELLEYRRCFKNFPPSH